jgi:hypothetical protein
MVGDLLKKPTTEKVMGLSSVLSEEIRQTLPHPGYVF